MLCMSLLWYKQVSKYCLLLVYHTAVWNAKDYIGLSTSMCTIAQLSENEPNGRHLGYCVPLLHSVCHSLVITSVTFVFYHSLFIYTVVHFCLMSLLYILCILCIASLLMIIYEELNWGWDDRAYTAIYAWNYVTGMVDPRMARTHVQ